MQACLLKPLLLPARHASKYGWKGTNLIGEMSNKILRIVVVVMYRKGGRIPGETRLDKALRWQLTCST